MYNFNLMFYHLRQMDPTRPGHTCKFSDPIWPDPTDPTRGSGQQSCNSGLTNNYTQFSRRAF